MPERRKIEVFSAGCADCEEAVLRVRVASCPDCEVQVLDLREEAAARRDARYGVRSVPAVAIDGTLAPCCANRGPDVSTLRAAGLGGRGYFTISQLPSGCRHAVP